VDIKNTGGHIRMRAKALAFLKNENRMMDFGIAFAGDRAVVTYRSGKHPIYHTDVYYYNGLFFWLRLGGACREVWDQIKYKTCSKCGQSINKVDSPTD
jgi:hypothetical protein